MYPSLDPYIQKVNEQSALLKNAPTERQAGVDKVKAEQDYAGKRSAVDTATKALYETQKRLDILPENLKQRLTGRPVTQAQLDRRIGAESEPLAAQAKSMALSRGQASDSLSLVDKAIQDYIGQFNTDTATRAQGLGAEADALFKRYQTDDAAARAAEERKFQKEMADLERANNLRIAQMSIPRTTTPTTTPDPTPKPGSRTTVGSDIYEMQADGSWKIVNQGNSIGSTLRQNVSDMGKAFTIFAGQKGSAGDTGGLSFNPVTIANRAKTDAYQTALNNLISKNPGQVVKMSDGQTFWKNPATGKVEPFRIGQTVK